MEKVQNIISIKNYFSCDKFNNSSIQSERKWLNII